MPRNRLALLFSFLLMLAGLQASVGSFLARKPKELPGSAASKEYNDLDRRLQHDCEDGKLDEFTLLESALIAGGVRTQQEVRHYQRRVDVLTNSLGDEMHAAVDQESKLDLLHRRLHERLLTGEYRPEYSELAKALDEGHYNCVTATLLFQSMAERCGIDTVAHTTQSHVLCCVPGEPKLYIETTCRDWRSAPVDGYPRQVRAQVLGGRELNAVQLLGKVYYNRGITELEAGRFAAAVDRFGTALRLDPCDTAARENLLAAYNNWALAESDAGQFAAARLILLRGLSLDATYAPLLANDLHIHQQWIKRLRTAGEYAAAMEILEDGFRRRPDAELFDRGRIAVHTLWLSSQSAHGELPAHGK